ncbi:MAG TPA: nicotinate (nicotinamide) nucleotide adenylyltransferase [Spirochaetota bacterium]|nr:nicotinate (nicotinamide) nucleotide adenylyltransferase [Spirochaetota bacterium]
MSGYAIFGGSFNPPHKAHLYIVTQYHRLFPGHKVFIIPCHYPPHKKKTFFLKDKDRLELTRILFSGKKYTSILPYEINKKGISYTIDTVKYIKKKYSISKPLHIIIGDDLLPELDQWKDFDKLQKQAVFICFNRYGRRQHTDNLYYYSIKPYPLSSTALRKDMKKLYTGRKLNRYLTRRQITYLKKEKIL